MKLSLKQVKNHCCIHAHIKYFPRLLPAYTEANIDDFSFQLPQLSSALRGMKVDQEFHLVICSHRYNTEILHQCSHQWRCLQIVFIGLTSVGWVFQYSLYTVIWGEITSMSFFYQIVIKVSAFNMHSVHGNSSQATTRFSALDFLSPGIIEVMSSDKKCYTSGYLNFLVQQITLLQRFCGDSLL